MECKIITLSPCEKISLSFRLMALSNEPLELDIEICCVGRSQIDVWIILKLILDRIQWYGLD
jgi:hypothetical protein